MNTATHSFGKSLFELLSSMRFAISLLSILAVASIIGTVLKQAEPYANYIIQFGPFWFQVFEKLGLYDVYHAGWFLVILTFLVASTSVCIWRNAPNFAREMKSFREHVSEQSLNAFKHKHEVATEQPPEALAASAQRYLEGQGYKVKSLPREDGVLLAAKAGSWNRLGYFLAHSAIVMICIGGLMDGNLIFKAQQLLGIKKIETRDIPQSQVPAISRLSPSNPSFRGSVQIPEGSSADVAFLNVADGYLVQELPFTVALKQFRIEHYSTGQPKSFESDVELFDRAGNKIREATIAVNHPLIHDGVAIYQASFADGGTRLKLRGWNLFAPTASSDFPIEGTVHQNTTLTSGGRLHARIHRFSSVQHREHGRRNRGGGRRHHERARRQPGQRQSPSAQRRPELPVQAARCTRAGARVFQLHAAAGTRRPLVPDVGGARVAQRGLPLPAHAARCGRQHRQLHAPARRAAECGTASRNRRALRPPGAAAGGLGQRNRGQAEVQRHPGAGPVCRRRLPVAGTLHRGAGARARTRKGGRHLSAHSGTRRVRGAAARQPPGRAAPRPRATTPPAGWCATPSTA
jgi:cytochrome c biogenesis protein ResB